MDFSKVGAIPPPGTFRFLVKEAKVLPTKAKDSHNLVVKAEIQDYPGDEEFEGYKKTLYFSLKQNALFGLQNFLEAVTQEEWRDEDLGIEIDDDNDLIDPNIIDKTFLGVCAAGSYNNRPQLDVHTFVPDNGEFEIQVQEASESDPF